MVEKLLQDISKELSVLEVMSVFNGALTPLRRLRPVLVEFIRERLLYGQKPLRNAEHSDIAVRNFLHGCLPSLRAIEVSHLVTQCVRIEHLFCVRRDWCVFLFYMFLTCKTIVID